MGFHRTVLKQFFCLLSSLYDKYNLNSDNIYIVGGTGISSVPSKQIKVLGLSEKMLARESKKKTVTNTVVACVTILSKSDWH
jgi:hypothetical protein